MRSIGLTSIIIYHLPVFFLSTCECDICSMNSFLSRDLSTQTNHVGQKRRGFGEGLYNGFGGKVEKGEHVIEAAVRELQEECGLVADKDEMWKSR